MKYVKLLIQKMIDPKDLRLGNLVYNTLIKHNVTVSLGNINNCYDFIPIEINEEYLNKLGFTKSSSLIYFKENIGLEFEGAYYNAIVRKKRIASTSFWKLDAEIKYVHELQNLWYDLKKEELLKVNITYEDKIMEKHIVIVKPNTVKPKDKERLAKNGFIVVEHENAHEFFILSSPKGEEKHLLMCALYEINKGISGNHFTKELERRLKEAENNKLKQP